MTIEEYKNKYRGQTQAQVRKLASESSEFRVETEMLYRKVSGSSLNKNCSECWVDAYAVIIKADPAESEKRAKRKFDLKAGALLIDRVKGDNSKMCSMHNITDELALYSAGIRRTGRNLCRHLPRSPRRRPSQEGKSPSPRNRHPRSQYRSSRRKSRKRRPRSRQRRRATGRLF